MEDVERAVRRLKAEGRSYRQIARQLGIPLTRAYKLATATPPAAEDAPLPVSTVSTDDLQDAPLEDAPPAPEPPPPVPAAPRGVQLGDLHGPFTMPTPEELARPYTMPGPNGMVLVITPGAGGR